MIIVLKPICLYFIISPTFHLYHLIIACYSHDKTGLIIYCKSTDNSKRIMILLKHDVIPGLYTLSSNSHRYLRNSSFILVCLKIML